MKAIITTGSILVAISFGIFLPTGYSAPPADLEWAKRAKTGDYVGALRALDAARSKVVKQYSADVQKALPQSIANLKAGKLEDNTATIQIALLQAYAGAGREIRIDLKVPTVDIERRKRVESGAAQNIRDIVRGGKRQSSEQMVYSIQQGFASQIRRDSIFATRPQFMAYLSNGATITIHAVTDIPLEAFKKIVDDVPLKKLDAAISGASDE